MKNLIILTILTVSVASVSGQGCQGTAKCGQALQESLREAGGDNAKLCSAGNKALACFERYKESCGSDAAKAIDQALEQGRKLLNQHGCTTTSPAGLPVSSILTSLMMAFVVFVHQKF